jgi:hypothetical protein
VLRGYYTRKGSRFIFANGMSLNKLAMEIWERLNFSDMDVSTLSRVLSGERIFTVDQLEVFCELLKIRGRKKEELLSALGNDVHKRYGFKVDLIDKIRKEMTDFIDASLGHFSIVKRTAPFDTLKLWLDQLSFWTERSIVLEKGTSRKKLFYLRAEILMNYVWFFPCVTDDWDKNRIKVKMLSEKITETAKILKRTDLMEKSKVILHQYKYFKGDFSGVLKIIESVNFDYMADREYEVDLLRAAMVSYANMGDENSYRAVCRYAIKNKQFYTNDLKSKLYQGMSRAEATLKNYALSRKLLDKSWDYFFKSRKDSDFLTHRELQLANTEIEIALESGSKNKELYEKMGKEAISLSNYLNHSYYGKAMERNLKKLL